VEACVLECDYVTAYRLLGVGGLYFQVQKSQNVSANTAKQPIDNIEVTEFLSERICQHPIFQNPLLWRAALTDRLQTALHLSSNDEVVDHQLDTDTVFHEAYALLFIINRMGVNYERAAAFSWLLVKDYFLNKNRCVQLMEYTSGLYGRLEDVLSDPGNIINSMAFLTDCSIPNSSFHMIEDSLDDNTADIIDLTHLLPKSHRPHPSSSRKLFSISQSLSSTSVSPGRPSLGRPKSDRTLSFFGKERTLSFSGSEKRQGRGDLQRSGSSYKTKSFGYVDEGREVEQRGMYPIGSIERYNCIKNEVQEVKEVLQSSPFISRSNSKDGGEGEVSTIRRIRNLFSRRSVGDKGDIKQTSPAAALVDRYQYQSPIRPSQNAQVAKIVSPKSSLSLPTSLDPLEVANSDSQSQSNQSQSNQSQSQTQSTHSQKSSVFSAGGTSSMNGNGNEKKHEGVQDGYTMIALKGSPTDQVMSIGTLGQYLIAGLQNGTVNVNNLMTGKLVAKLSHSNSNLIIFNSVTHIQCVPHEGFSNNLESYNSTKDNTKVVKEWEKTQGVFATACSGGVVKIWCMEVSSEGQGGKKTKYQDLNVDNKAIILAHEGASITSLVIGVNTFPSLIKKDETIELKKKSENHWIIASGDDKGNIVISQGGWDSSKAPTLSDGEMEVPNDIDENNSKRRRYFRSNRKLIKAGSEGSVIRENEEVGISFLSMVTVLRGSGGVTALTFGTLGEGDDGSGGVERGGRYTGKSLIAGSTSGLMAVIDISTGQCKYILKGHTSTVTSIISLPLPIQCDTEGNKVMDGSMIWISCGLDRRLIFWDIPIPDKGSERRPPSYVEGYILGEQRNIFDKNKNCHCANTVSHLPDRNSCIYSSSGPLTAMLAHPATALLPRKDEDEGRETGQYQVSLVAASADGSIALWDLRFRPQKKRGIHVEEITTERGSGFSHPIRILRGHTDRIVSIQWKERSRESFGGDGRVFQTVSLDGDMREWSTYNVSTEINNVGDLVYSHSLILDANRRNHTYINNYRCCTVVKVFPVGDTYGATGISMFFTSSYCSDFLNHSTSTTYPGNFSSRLVSYPEKKQVEIFEDCKESLSMDNDTSCDKVEMSPRGNEYISTTPGALSSRSVHKKTERERDRGTSWLVGVSMDGVIKAFSYQNSVPFHPTSSHLESIKYTDV
jgi:hypothetical protein